MRDHCHNVLRATLAALLSFGCSTSSCGTLNEAPRLDCGTPIRGAEQLLRRGAIVLIGEIHGTQEIPKAVGDLTCHALRSGMQVRVGFEASQSYNGEFQRYIASRGNMTDRTRLLGAAHWRAEFPDGRSSQSNFDLLERLRAFRSGGFDIASFMLTSDNPFVSSEQEMAESVVEARASSPEALLLVIAGNNHTRVDVPHEPGARLKAIGLPVQSITVSYSGGTYWGCPVPCGARPVGGGRERGHERFIELKSVLLGDGLQPAFDGVLYLGRLTASPPPKVDAG